MLNEHMRDVKPAAEYILLDCSADDVPKNVHKFKMS